MNAVHSRTAQTKVTEPDPFFPHYDKRFWHKWRHILFIHDATTFLKAGTKMTYPEIQQTEVITSGA